MTPCISTLFAYFLSWYILLQKELLLVYLREKKDCFYATILQFH